MFPGIDSVAALHNNKTNIQSQLVEKSLWLTKANI
jgi:hypothetical protein